MKISKILRKLPKLKTNCKLKNINRLHFSENIKLDKSLIDLMQNEDEHSLFMERANNLLDQGVIKLEGYDSNKIIINNQEIGIPFIMHGVQMKPEERAGGKFKIINKRVYDKASHGKCKSPRANHDELFPEIIHWIFARNFKF
jgi:hypothetical protein